MKVLVSGCTATVRRLVRKYREELGVLKIPNEGNAFMTQVRATGYMACDNSAFSYFNQERFERMVWDAWSLEMERGGRVNWVTVPDVVGDHKQTLEMFREWVDYWEYEFGYVPVPLAFVLQNGCTPDEVPWDEIAAVFVGGDDQFKLHDSIPLCHEAKERGKWVHVGRVNSPSRLVHVIRHHEADSVDGTGASKAGDINLEVLLKTARYECSGLQKTLW